MNFPLHLLSLSLEITFTSSYLSPSLSYRFDKEELLNLDYSAYLASSGDEEDDDEPKWGTGEGEEEQIKKYRVSTSGEDWQLEVLLEQCALQALLDEGTKPVQESQNGELEITWNVGQWLKLRMVVIETAVLRGAKYVMVDVAKRGNLHNDGCGQWWAWSIVSSGCGCEVD